MASETTEILMLHRVLPNEPAAFGLPSCYRLRGTAITPDEFERLLDTVGTVVPLDAVERALAHDLSPPAGTVLTFDDGYREHLDLVAPALRRREMSATFYVATGLHGDAREVAPVDAWYWLLDHARSPIGRVPLGSAGEYERRLDTVTDKLAWVLGPPKRRLLESDPADQQALIAALADSLGVELPPELARELYLSRTEWSQLASPPLRIGAHSVSHPRLSLLSDRDLHAEIDESVNELAPLTRPVAFAYPDGDFDQRVLSRSRSTTSSAVTCEPGVVTQGSDLYRLPRKFFRPPSSPPAFG